VLLRGVVSPHHFFWFSFGTQTGIELQQLQPHGQDSVQSFDYSLPSIKRAWISYIYHAGSFHGNDFLHISDIVTLVLLVGISNLEKDIQRIAASHSFTVWRAERIYVLYVQGLAFTVLLASVTNL
jgi:hypothetical protein